eukprot:CAMPEP_0202861346 /NCGR_PEP_ID=MMETSP1391-20130828/2779_1 /ASSEMBLY_ACC=CAM_ASM_000867 /TAXON_ID=1034604 /ORGANISM="Chlamydomonas leiostraca, Strain SAG 11-49" /LENGTH=86 /DNA_ID=CAMNT_0049540723 /DNA_START=39 /DNA_END=299 /DNA_ORIENTATION=+
MLYSVAIAAYAQIRRTGGTDCAQTLIVLGARGSAVNQEDSIHSSAVRLITRPGILSPDHGSSSDNPLINVMEVCRYAVTRPGNTVV